MKYEHGIRPGSKSLLKAFTKGNLDIHFYLSELYKNKPLCKNLKNIKKNKTGLVYVNAIEVEILAFNNWKLEMQIHKK